MGISMKPILLLSTAVYALTAGNVIAGSHPALVGPRADAHAFQLPASHLLYNQNSNFGYGIVSQNFTSGSDSSYNSAAADDFVIPAGATWNITRVDAAGVYFNG